MSRFSPEEIHKQIHPLFLQIAQKESDKQHQDEWFIYVNHQLIEPKTALEKILQSDKSLGNKSTASLFLLALRYALSEKHSIAYQQLDLSSQITLPPPITEIILDEEEEESEEEEEHEEEEEMMIERVEEPVEVVMKERHALSKLLSAAESAQSEFERKLAFRLMTTESPDKLLALLRLIINFPVSEQLNLNHLLSCCLLSLQTLKQLILPTIDVRKVILKKYYFLLNWIYYSFCFYLDLDLGNLLVLQLLENSLKILQDIFLVSSKDDYLIHLEALSLFLGYIFKHPQTFRHTQILDQSLKLFSYYLEMIHPSVVGEEVAKQYDPYKREIYNFFFQQQTKDVHLVLCFLQQLASHLISHLPQDMHLDCQQWLLQYKHQLETQIQDLPPPFLAHPLMMMQFILRALMILPSQLLQHTSRVLFLTQKEIKIGKQIPLHRQCESCGVEEEQFGQFMMCAGCRRVRYCSKYCQVRDWKWHRMSCLFFRPKPGWRSRGTQCPVEHSSQTAGDEMDVLVEELGVAGSSSEGTPVVGKKKRRETQPYLTTSQNSLLVDHTTATSTGSATAAGTSSTNNEGQQTSNSSSSSRFNSIGIQTDLSFLNHPYYHSRISISEKGCQTDY